MNGFERRLQDKVADAYVGATPGMLIDVHRRGRRVGLVDFGKTYRYYDLASLTKILFTASRAIMHFSEYPAELGMKLPEILPWWKNRTTTPSKLMSHSAGLEWWLPVYKKLRGPLVPESRWKQLKTHLAKIKTHRQKRAIYSDIDLWMMGEFLEARLQLSLSEMWLEVQERLKLGELFFHPGNTPRKRRSLYAPTEDCPWRGRVLQGEVHDENCWALGGVAPHAGLFGTIEAVSDWGLKLRAAFLREPAGQSFGNPKMVNHFVGRRVPREVGDWGLCFMKPSVPRSSCGKHFSLRSFGHTGFTGTSLWYDPVEDLLVVILSNRVHPTRENRAFAALRPKLHDWIVESL